MKERKLFTQLLIMAILIFTPYIVHAQDQKVKLTGRNITLKMAFDQIEKQTALSVDYNAKTIDVTRKLDSTPNSGTLTTVLIQLLRNTGCTYLIKESHIVIISTSKILEQQHLATKEELADIKSISGTVTDILGNPIIGVSILVSGGNKGTVTDLNGRYKIDANQGATLIISYIGYKKQQILVEDNGTIDIKLLENSNTLNEVVSIGYGTVKKIDLTGAVGTLKGKQINAGIDNQFTISLQGRIAGLKVSPDDGGTPGTGGDLVVRGVASLNGSGPLIIVDDIPGVKLSGINMNDIESIQVLKDAASAAIYGSRAANGVVIITTKKGVEGKLMVSANLDYGVQSTSRYKGMCTTDEWLKVITEMYKPKGLILPEIATNPQVMGNGTDWQDAVFRLANVHNYSISANGGSKNLTYNASVNYINHSGVNIKHNFNIFNAKINTIFTKGRFRIGESINCSNENQTRGNDGLYRSVLMIPAYQIYNNNVPGGYQDVSGTEVLNPVALTNLNRTLKDKRTTNDLNLFAEISITDGLIFRSGYLYRSGTRNCVEFKKICNLSDNESYKYNWMKRYSIDATSWSLENRLNYNKILNGKHSINAVLGHTAYYDSETDYNQEGSGMPNDIWELTSATRDIKVQSTTNTITLESYISRLVYSYGHCYSLSASYSRDGTSLYDKSKRWGNFLSIGLGWNIANESFFRNLKTPISALKLRGSCGELGNSNGRPYSFDRTIESGSISYITGTPSTLWSGTIENAIANTDLQWEKSTSGNIGVDLELWNGKLTYTLDMYNKITSNLIMEVSTSSGVPPSVGVTNNTTNLDGTPISYYINAGKISNKGIEMAFTYNGQLGKLNYSVTGNYAYIDNHIISLNNGRTSIPLGIGPRTTVLYTKSGYPVYGFYLLQTDGLFRNEAEINSYVKDGNLIQPFAKVGDVRYKDSNNDGKITEADRVYSGSPIPPHEFGLSINGVWNSFDINLCFVGQIGNKIYNVLRAYSESGNYLTNFATTLLNSYTFNTNSNIPRLEFQDKNGNGLDYTDRWLEDGSFVNVNSAQLGYTLPEKFVQNLYIDKCRIYFALGNLATWTKYTGVNPNIHTNGSKAGIDNPRTPNVISFHIGVNLNF